MDLQEQNLSHINIKQSDEIFYFEHNVYNEKKLGEYISKERLDYIITECEKIVCMCHVKKSQYEKQDIKKFVYILSNVSVASFILFFIILYYFPRIKKKRKIYLFEIYFGVIGYIILLIIIIYNAFKKKTNEKFVNDFINEDLTKYFLSLKKKFKKITFKYNKENKMIILFYPKENDNIIQIKIDKKSEIILETEGNNYLPTKESAENFIQNDDDKIT